MAAPVGGLNGGQESLGREGAVDLAAVDEHRWGLDDAALGGLVGGLADPVVVGAVPDLLLELLAGQPELAAELQEAVGTAPF
jgi:hypothetical protein